MDACLKLDRYLGDFIDYIDDEIGLENVLFVLTADHCGLPLPEYVIEKGGKGGRINNSHFQEALQWIDEECEERLGSNLYFRDGANFFLNKKKMKTENINTDTVYNIVSQYLLNVEGIEKMIIKTTANTDILFDPQTSGPLLATVPKSKVKGIIISGEELGFECKVIGELTNGKPYIEVL